MERRITGRPLCRNQYKSWFGSGPQSLYQYSDVSRVRRCSGLQTTGPFEILYGCLTKVFNVPDSPLPGCIGQTRRRPAKDNDAAEPLSKSAN